MGGVSARYDGLGSLSALRLKRASTGEQVAERLREMILAGQIEQGSALREATLAERFGVSRNTMREAIRVLAREGLVMHHLHRGALVTRLTERDVEDIFRVRRTVELEAVRAAKRASPEQLDELTKAVDQLEAAASTFHWAAIIDADQLFHERLVAVLGSRRLDRFFNGIQAEMRLCMSIIDRHDLARNALVREHQEILALLRRRETRRCLELMAEQLSVDEQRLKQIVSGRTT